MAGQLSYSALSEFAVLTQRRREEEEGAPRPRAGAAMSGAGPAKPARPGRPGRQKRGLGAGADMYAPREPVALWG